MDDDLLKLADLKYQKFRDHIDRKVQSKETEFAEVLGGKGLLRSSDAIKILLDLYFEKAKILYQKRIEIEKEQMFAKYGYLPHSGLEQLKRTARGIIAREMRILSEHPRLKWRGVPSHALEQIQEKEISLGLELDRDIEIEEGEDKLRLEKAKRERFAPELVNSLMEIFDLRDKVNLLFKNRFGFELLKLEHEGVLPEIATPCKNENDFVRKVLVLGDLIDWMDVRAIKSRLSEGLEGAKSIGVLDQLLSQEFGTFDSMIIQNLRDINTLRNNKFPVHKEGEEVIKLFDRLGVRYPPDNWGSVWEKVVTLYMDSIKGLINLLKERKE